MALSEQDKVLIEENLGFTLSDLFKDPNGYGISEEQLDTLTDLLTALPEGSFATWMNSYNGFISASAKATTDLSALNRGYDKSTTTRTFTKKDEQGNVIFENGEPLTVEVQLDKFFPSNNFYDTFYDTLTRQEVAAIQDKAINAGIIDEDDLGDEINGIKGAVTEGLVITILNYAIEEMEQFTPDSLERNAFLDRVQEAKKRGAAPEINALFGGVNFAENKLSDNQILSRQIFQIAFNEFEKLTKSEQKAFDAKRAREIVADNILPSNKDILQDLEDLYKSMYGETMSDRRKQEFIDDIAVQWSPYVQALIAQDKYIRAGEIYKTMIEKPTVDPITEMPSTKYVQLDTPVLQDAFNIQNPITTAKEQIMEEAESDAQFQQSGITVRDAQKAYMNYIMGGRG